MTAIKNNKILTIHIGLIVILLLYFLLAPGWWRSSSIDHLKEIYPRFYGIIYYYQHFLIYLHGGCILYFAFRILTTRLNKKDTPVSKFSDALNERGLTFSHVRSYLTANVYPRRIFVSKLFLKLIAFIYLIAFLSVLWQVSLVTENGIISYKEFKTQMLLNHGYQAIVDFPSVFWINQSNVFIYVILWISIVLSLISICWKPKAITYFFLWFFYLSIVSFGRDLFHFPWDTFLLEIGFLTVLLVFFVERFGTLPRIVLFAMLLLFFRQWFSMAMTKWAWSSIYWNDLSYMKLFWLNQPSPTSFASYVFYLPLSVQKGITVACLILEMLIPILLLFGRKAKITSFFISLGLSVIIELTGNFGFFNVLTIVLGLWCLDDHFFRRKTEDLSVRIVFGAFRKFFGKMALGMVFIVVLFNLFYVYLQFSKQSKHPLNCFNYFFVDQQEKYVADSDIRSFIFRTGKLISHFRIVSPHGVFKYIPNQRLHIRIQVKVKNRSWQEVTFVNGNDVTDLRFASPYMNRMPFYFYYQAYGIELRKLLQLNQKTMCLASTMSELMTKIEKGNKDVRQIMDYKYKGKIEQLRVIHNRLIPSESLNAKQVWVKSIPLDTIYFDPGQSSFLPVQAKEDYFF